jgi:hyaluronan synthase
MEARELAGGQADASAGTAVDELAEPFEPFEPTASETAAFEQGGEANDDSELIDERGLAELTARGSHLRRVRKKPRARGVVREIPKVRWTAGMIAWRVALSVVVLGAFAGLVAHGAASLVLAAGTPSLVSIALTVFGLVASGYFAATLWHAFRYQPVASYPDEKLPRVTVIVPAFNEGAAVRVALLSALASDYPADALEILAIDDGSTDDTWSHIEAVAAAHPDRIIAIKQPKNGGKREALVTGFNRATGDIAVTVDSDSKLEPHAIRAIVAPLIAEAEVGAVAGRVLVLNREDNLLTRLLSARFYITFDLARAAQSRFGAVLCTPGALSAYRMDGVRAVLERWSTQTFFGQPCTIAEDRALTTWLLREGYRSVYQRTAVVETLMPTTLPRMARMLVRWERGNIREDIVMLPLLFKRWRSRDQWWPTLEIVIELLQYPIAWIGLSLVAARLVESPGSIATVAGLVVFSAVVQTLYCLRSDRLADFFYGVAYALFAFVGLQWVFPYSLLTVRDGRWLTR